MALRNRRDASTSASGRRDKGRDELSRQTGNCSTNSLRGAQPRAQRLAKPKIWPKFFAGTTTKNLWSSEAEDLAEYSLLLAIIVLAIVASMHSLSVSVVKILSPAPSKEFLAIQSFLQALPTGNIAFNSPSSMEADRSYDIYLHLSTVQTAADLQKELQQNLKEQGIEAASLQVAPRMEARLTGETFKILTVTPETQAVDVQQVTEWRWEVTPTRGGERALHLTLSAILVLEGQPSSHAMRTFDRKIEVHVTAKKRIADFLHDHWDWTLASLGAIALAIWKFWKKWKEKKQRAWETP